MDKSRLYTSLTIWHFEQRNSNIKDIYGSTWNRNCFKRKLINDVVLKHKYIGFIQFYVFNFIMYDVYEVKVIVSKKQNLENIQNLVVMSKGDRDNHNNFPKHPYLYSYILKKCV